MQFIQRNETCYVPIVGRIILEGANGAPTASVLYDIPPVRREPIIYAEDGVYVAVNSDPTGTWHYRYTGPRSIQQVPTEFLRDYHPVGMCAACGRPL